MGDLEKKKDNQEKGRTRRLKNKRRIRKVFEREKGRRVEWKIQKEKYKEDVSEKGEELRLKDRGRKRQKN